MTATLECQDSCNNLDAKYLPLLGDANQNLVGQLANLCSLRPLLRAL